MTDRPQQDETSRTTYHFGEFQLNAARGALLRDGAEIKLRPKSLQVLHYLVKNAGVLVSKDQLHTEVWGQVVVTDDAITQCIVDIRRALEDSNQAIIRTVPRRGYIFELPVTQTDGADQKTTRPRRAGLRWIAVGALTLLALAAYVSIPPSPPTADSEDNYAVAVLPFADMSPNGDLQYFGDGVAEEILNILAQQSSLKVISRTSSFSFRESSKGIESIARDLGVSHVLEGSVRQDGDGVRVTAQLVDSANGGHLWSDTYDGTLEGVFAMQDDIAAQVATRLAATLDIKPVSRPQTTPEAYQLFLQARYLIDGPNFINENAESLLREVLSLDPEFAPAWRELSRLQWRHLTLGADSLGAVGRMRTSLEKALVLDPNDAGTLAYMAFQRADLDGDLTTAARFFERALEIDPQNEHALRTTHMFVASFGEPAPAIRLAEYSLSVNPVCHYCLYNLASAHLLAENVGEAISLFSRYRDLYEGGHSSLGVALWMGDRPDEALSSFSRERSEVWRYFGHSLAYHKLEHFEQRDQALDKFSRADGSRKEWLKAMLETVINEDHDAAFEALEAAVARYQLAVDGQIIRHGLVGLGEALRHPLLKGLRDDPRWSDLLHRLGLSSEQLAQVAFEMPPLPESTKFAKSR